MTDIISQIKAEDVEDGELPEDGEICDEEEEPMRPAPSTRPPILQKPAQMTAPPVEKPRESSTRTRRFEQNSPPRERDPDPFGSHNDAPDPPGSNEYFGDKDYRGAGGPSVATASSEEDQFNDTDYRVNRRRRLSPAHDDGEYESRSKRPFFNGRGGFRGGFRGGQKPRFQTDHQMCKFFREGYCRDGDNCSYSHQAEDSLRRPVLCNFYANTFCKKGLQCLMLHGEFPCKNFHKGQCQDDQCRFSHVPLTDYTRPIIEKILADEAARQPHQPPVYRQNPVANAAAAAAAAAVMPKRRVLLPGGPTPNGTSPPHSTQVIHAPVPQAAHPNQLPPPAVVVPTIQRNSTPSQMHQYPAPQATGGYFNTGPASRPEQVQGLPPPRTIEPPRPSNMQQPPMMRPMHSMGGQLQQPGLVQPPQVVVPERKPEPAAFNLEAMLNKLANGSSLRNQSPKSLIDDSPASPPPSSFTSNIFGNKPKVAVIPQTQQVVWGIVHCQRRLPYSNVENAERIPANDPRRAKAIAIQFDAFSSMIGSGNTTVSDPRLRAQQERKAAATTTTTQRVQDPALAAFSSWMPQIS
uniref:Zinc finger CCCH domain-containing protein 6 n=1 Tax=Caenorhabditis tropicalis TaxID=1561998 RepID=A0A1I7ULT2_9PELO